MLCIQPQTSSRSFQSPTTSDWTLNPSTWDPSVLKQQRGFIRMESKGLKHQEPPAWIKPNGSTFEELACRARWASDPPLKPIPQHLWLVRMGISERYPISQQCNLGWPSGLGPQTTSSFQARILFQGFLFGFLDFLNPKPLNSINLKPL